MGQSKHALDLLAARSELHFGYLKLSSNTRYSKLKTSRNKTNTMQLSSAYPLFVIEFSFEFGQKDNNFGVSFYAITFAVSISSWFNFCEFGMVNAFTKIHARPSQPFKNHPKRARNLTSVRRSRRTAPPYYNPQPRRWWSGNDHCLKPVKRPPKSREGSNPREALFRISITEKSTTRSHKRRRPRQKLREI